MSGFKAPGGVDLDSLFATRVTTAGSNSGFQNTAVDLSQRYEVRGATTAIGVTGFQVSGVDLNQKYKGLSAARVQLQAVVRHQISIAPTDARAGFRLNSSGVQESGVGTTAISYTTDLSWLLTGTNSQYDARATLTAGSNPTTGTMGTWLNLGTTREWKNEATGAGEAFDTTMTVEIRDASTLTVLATCSVEIWADTET